MDIVLGLAVIGGFGGYLLSDETSGRKIFWGSLYGGLLGVTVVVGMRLRDGFRATDVKMIITDR